ncbi:hypothetical protein AAGC94_18445 [Clostridium sporogenes]|uniref:hypothetical protein n=1 Tax=Clostridium sporogenes TaxID=1509 RepID=UPI00313A8661
MISEKSKQRKAKDESSEEKYRCGRIRSSDEVNVMLMERRDSVIYTSKIEQPKKKGRILWKKESRLKYLNIK